MIKYKWFKIKEDILVDITGTEKRKSYMAIVEIAGKRLTSNPIWTLKEAKQWIDGFKSHSPDWKALFDVNHVSEWHKPLYR